MRGADKRSGQRLPLARRRQLAAMAACIGLSLAVVRCSSNPPGGDPCNPDENGVTGSGTTVVLLEVSDTAFKVGTAEGGPPEPNITAENVASVQLTLTNVGTRPHDFVIQCQPTPNTNGCTTQSCFPADASIPSLKPGEKATRSFVTPIHEGNYPFISDLPGDTTAGPDGGLTGLVGQFVLM